MPKVRNGEAAPTSNNGTKSSAELDQEIDDVTDALLAKHGLTSAKTPPSAEEIEEDKARGRKKSDAATDDDAEDHGEENDETPEGDGDAGDDVGEEAESDEDKEAAADKAATAKLVRFKLKDLPDETRQLVQRVLDQRVGQVVARERDARDAALEKASTAEARVTELETELAETKKNGGGTRVVMPGVHPLFLAKSSSEIDDRLDEIEGFLEWADDHAEGYESPDESKHASWSAEQVRARARELRREKDRIIPQARQLLIDRAAKDAALQKTFPTLFKPGTEDYRAGQELRKLLPELGRHADANSLIARLILGAKALAALKQPATPANKKPQPKQAPRVPSGGSAKGSGSDDREPASASSAITTYLKDPNNAAARRKAFESLV